MKDNANNNLLFFHHDLTEERDVQKKLRDICHNPDNPLTIAKINALEFPLNALEAKRLIKIYGNPEKYAQLISIIEAPSIPLWLSDIIDLDSINPACLNQLIELYDPKKANPKKVQLQKILNDYNQLLTLQQIVELPSLSSKCLDRLIHLCIHDSIDPKVLTLVWNAIENIPFKTTLTLSKLLEFKPLSQSNLEFILKIYTDYNYRPLLTVVDNEPYLFQKLLNLYSSLQYLPDYHNQRLRYRDNLTKIFIRLPKNELHPFLKALDTILNKYGQPILKKILCMPYNQLKRMSTNAEELKNFEIAYIKQSNFLTLFTSEIQDQEHIDSMEIPYKNN